MLLRIDKYLADMGVGTRTEIKNYIKKKMVMINNTIVTNPAIKADTDNDIVTFKNNEIPYVTFEYYILNKPAGVLSASSDKKALTVVDMIKSKRKDLFPVGRLDKDTEGLLLITNDGALSHELLSPKKHVDKKYYVQVNGKLLQEHISLMEKGFQVDDDLYALPALLEIIDEQHAYITIHEGKFHQIKRMMQAIGCEVTYLKRISMGNLVLPEELECGSYRALTDSELKGIKNIVK